MSELRLHKKSQSAERKRPKKHKFQLVSLCHRQVSPRRVLAASCTLETCTAASGGWGGVKGWRVIHLEITHPFHWIHMSAPQQPG